MNRGGPNCAAGRPQAARGGFSLIELLVVVALIAGLAAWMIGGSDGGRGAALQSAQAALANGISAARMRAIAAGGSTRLLVQVDSRSPHARDRYLRQIVVQQQGDAGWQTVSAFQLPRGVYVVPGNFSAMPPGLFPAAAGPTWTRGDGTTPLRSTALRANSIASEAVLSPVVEQWASIGFGATGGTAQSGDIVLVTGRERSPGSVGDSPVELLAPERSCGLTVSSYGMTALINGRESF